ncbi:hypothetical protein ABT336_14505 [Micromonospora sp. NPDC000207]|uniref:hypothetical protein n=1 Tax=Micromonospora sp. NPDC000207 TaxID=3154246 RepID=UPI003319C45D
MADQIINLTPHDMHVYPPDCPDRIEPGSVQPIAVIPPAPAEMRAPLDKTRIRVESPLTFNGAEIPVNVVQHHGSSNLPPPERGVWFVVALVVGLANPDRRDLLVPDEAVRNLGGSMIGCRSFGLPYGGESRG